jgi:hypothetical protein
MRELLEGVSRALKISDLAVERLDSPGGQLAGAGPVLAGVELKKFLDLLQGEPCRLSLSNEPQAANIFRPVVTKADLARRLPKEALSLVEANGFNTHSAGCCEFADRQCF